MSEEGTFEPFDFEHINLNDIDDGYKPVDANVYTLEINKITPKQVKITKAGSPYEGQTVLVLNCSLTIVDDEKFSNRKLWKDLWLNRKNGKVSAKKIAKSTGVLQLEGQTISEWAEQFETLSPSARLQAPVTKGKPYNDPTGDDENDINFYSAKPV